ncbi:ABC-type uncharacterized transport system periplasmic component-like protein [Magnetococcus marinus MC-1]|uniref:ABC-type uncharacterized transport system periplasmic component-like protein n=1 Tax=Magnetococcus marinus (strain ATCC BAA-1437 / JCM 17883 / MC-1) TaxID=156889 RepID=A0LD09_MAGMM|nr:ABC transporter substrate binding protein [Magnetococcus marinus]ABK45852.1 ABC-type uncharacterized transport system periplasmic component-like protein [Magnetococcus marinus MC-1]
MAPHPQRKRLCNPLFRAVLGMVLLLGFARSSWANTEFPPRYQVILMPTLAAPTIDSQTSAFIQQLHHLGFQSGVNLDLHILRPNGDRQQARALLTEALAQRRPDLVVTSATIASQEALALLKGQNIPLLFMTVADPVEAGLVASLDKPNTTPVTGFSNSADRAVLLSIIKQLLNWPAMQRPIRIGLIHSDYPAAMGDAKQLEQLMHTQPLITLVQRVIPYQEEQEQLPNMLSALQQAIVALESEVDYWWSPHDPIADGADYMTLFNNHSKHPVLFGLTLRSVQQGALLHLSPDSVATGKEAAQRAVAILLGTPAEKLPITSPKMMAFGLNLATAIKMDLVVPSQIMELAKGNLYQTVSP